MVGWAKSGDTWEDEWANGRYHSDTEPSAKGGQMNTKFPFPLFKMDSEKQRIKRDSGEGAAENLKVAGNVLDVS